MALTHAHLDVAGIPRHLDGKRLTLAERLTLYEEEKRRKARREELAAETGYPTNMWKG